MEAQQDARSSPGQTEVDSAGGKQGGDDAGSRQNSSGDKTPPNTTSGDEKPPMRPSTPPLSVEDSQKLIENVSKMPPEAQQHPQVQADLEQAKRVVAGEAASKAQPSTPPLSVEDSRKLIENVSKMPPEARQNPKVQADRKQAEQVLQDHVQQLESQKEPLSEAQKKELADAKAALVRLNLDNAGDDSGSNATKTESDKNNVPAAKWLVPQEPHHLQPSLPYDANRKPRGSPKTLNKNDTDLHNERGVNGENEAANVLAQYGYDYEQIREANKSPDGKVAGVADKWDTYSPHAGKNLRGIRDLIVDKVDQQNAPYVVIRLEPNGQDVNDLGEYLKQYPVQGLKQLFVVKNGKLYILH